MQACLQVELRAKQSHQGPEEGETGGHRQYIGQRQIEPAPATDLTAQHHTGKNRQHGQYAGRKGQAQAREKEQRQFTPAPVTGCRCAVAIDVQAFGLGWVAQAFIGTALIGHGQGKGALISARQFHVENAVVDLDVAKVLVMLLLPVRQSCSAEGDIGWIGAKLKAVAVEVITFGGHEAQLDRLRRAFHQAELEGFAHRQEIGAVVDRTQRRTGPTLQQPGGGGRQGEH